MKKQYFGQDNFIWWKGVVESRNDPLKLGRCKVRIFGWHQDSIDQQSTESLPWAHPLVPLDFGKNTVGPKEGDWVMGFFADGEDAQRPMMMSIIPGMNESKAPSLDERTGHQDLRPDDILEGHQQPYPPDHANIKQGGVGEGTTITEYAVKSRYPDSRSLREPDTSRYARGFSYGVILKATGLNLKKKLKETEKLKKSFAEPLNRLLDKDNELKDPDVALPRDINKKDKVKEDEPALELGTVIFQNLEGDITTPEGRDAILRSGGYTAAGTVLWEQGGQIFLVDIFGTFTKGKVFLEDGSEMKVEEVIPQPMGHLYRSILRPKVLNALKQKYIPIGECLEGNGEFAQIGRNVGAVWSEPLPPYRTQYPYNHVYESESGHLLEFDDTPGFERIHLYHRSGTFEEVHPNGLKVEKVVNDSYRYYLKNEFKHTEGKQYHTIDKGVRILGNRDGDDDAHFTIMVGPNSNFNVCTVGGQINFYSEEELQIFAHADVNVDCENAKIHTAQDTIIHTEGDVDWRCDGDMKFTVAGSFLQTVGVDKTTSVANNYSKTVGDNYTSVAGDGIRDIAGGSHSTQAAVGISETSYVVNSRTCGLAIIDTSLTQTELTTTFHMRLTGDNQLDITGGIALDINALDVHASAEGNIRLAPFDTKIAAVKVNASGAILDATGSITSAGFLTSNGIIHGSEEV